MLIFFKKIRVFYVNIKKKTKNKGFYVNIKNKNKGFLC
jgi:hypothetical protein